MKIFFWFFVGYSYYFVFLRLSYCHHVTRSRKSTRCVQPVHFSLLFSGWVREFQIAVVVVFTFHFFIPKIIMFKKKKKECVSVGCHSFRFRVKYILSAQNVLFYFLKLFCILYFYAWPDFLLLREYYAVMSGCWPKKKISTTKRRNLWTTMASSTKWRSNLFSF